jgi:hypothetical protein
VLRLKVIYRIGLHIPPKQFQALRQQIEQMPGK